MDSPSTSTVPPVPAPPLDPLPPLALVPPELASADGVGDSELVKVCDGPLPGGDVVTPVDPYKLAVECTDKELTPALEASATDTAFELLFFAPTMPPTTAAMTTMMSIATIPMIPLGVRQNGRLAIDAGALPDSAMRNFSFDTFSGIAGVAGGNGAPGSGTAPYGGAGVAAGVRTDCERCGRLSRRSTS